MKILKCKLQNYFSRLFLLFCIYFLTGTRFFLDGHFQSFPPVITSCIVLLSSTILYGLAMTALGKILSTIIISCPGHSTTSQTVLTTIPTDLLDVCDIMRLSFRAISLSGKRTACEYQQLG